MYTRYTWGQYSEWTNEFIFLCSTKIKTFTKPEYNQMWHAGNSTWPQPHNVMFLERPCTAWQTWRRYISQSWIVARELKRVKISLFQSGLNSNQQPAPSVNMQQCVLCVSRALNIWNALWWSSRAASALHLSIILLVLTHDSSNAAKLYTNSSAHCTYSSTSPTESTVN